MTEDAFKHRDKTSEHVVGATLGDRYDIVEIVSSGAAGDVYKVRHRELNKLFAAKVMRNEQTQHSIQRFRREAQMLCKLRHPNIVTVHSFGIDDRLGPYLIMDLLDGVDLLSLVKKCGPLPLESAGKLLIGICDGMSNAHEYGIVHRDIKPSNVMIVGQGDEQRAVIIDFGAGKWLDSEAQQKLTKTTAVVGTPMYMAPEQCMAQGVDKRTDVYAMGCLMYEVLTGKPPFDGDSSFEIMQKHLAEMPAPPSVANPTAMIPSQIDQVVTMALQKRAGERLDTFSKIKEALEIAMQRPTYSKMFAPKKDTEVKVEPRRRLLMAGVTALFAVLLAVGFFFHRKMEEAQVPKVTAPRPEPFVRLRDQMNHLMGSRQFDEARRFGEQTVNRAEFKDQPNADRGMFELTLAMAQLRSGHPDEARETLLKASPLLGDNIHNNVQFHFAMVQISFAKHQWRVADQQLGLLQPYLDQQSLGPDELRDYYSFKAALAGARRNFDEQQEWADKLKQLAP